MMIAVALVVIAIPISNGDIAEVDPDDCSGGGRDSGALSERSATRPSGANERLQAILRFYGPWPQERTYRTIPQKRTRAQPEHSNDGSVKLLLVSPVAARGFSPQHPSTY